MDIRPTLDKIQTVSGKDIGDFGGFHGLIDYLKANWSEELPDEITRLEAYRIDENASVYVGTYAKYNAGSIAGAWVDLTRFDDHESFLAFCHELHKDEEDPELMYQDFQNFPHEYYSESGINPELWDYLELTDDDKMMLDAFRDCFGATDSIENARNAYYGQYESDEDMAWELLESTGGLNEVPDVLKYYFDVEKYARDLMISDFSSSNGFYFLNNW